MLKGTHRCWCSIFSHPYDVFFRDVPAYLSKTILSDMLHNKKAWLHNKRVPALDRYSCSPDLVHYETQTMKTETPD